MNVVIDISRFISRAHLPFDTGIDRVERAAILDAFDRYQTPYFLGRVGKKYVLLDREKMRKFVDLETAQKWPHARVADRLRLKLSLAQRRVRTGLTDIGIVGFSIDELASKMKEVNLTPFQYLNFGHANLNETFLSQLREAGAETLSVFLHDVIPIDFPQYCRPDKIESFKSSFENVLKYSDQLFCNSHYTAERIANHAAITGADPKIQMIPLACTTQSRSKLVPRSVNNKPTFAILGTIEPRKNLGFLLDVWDDLGLTLGADEMPNLLVIGKRGWESDEIYDRLDEAVVSGFVFEFDGLDDKAVQEYLVNCHALLFPSHVEGYGLPAQEALSLGVPVIGSDIPVFQELFGDCAKLISTESTDEWIEKIESIIEVPLAKMEPQMQLRNSSSWKHFFDTLYKNQKPE